MDRTGKPLHSTYTSYTVLVEAPDIILENLTIRNTAGRVGQAVALNVQGDRFVCRNCILLGQPGYPVRRRRRLPGSTTKTA